MCNNERLPSKLQLTITALSCFFLSSISSFFSCLLNVTAPQCLLKRSTEINKHHSQESMRIKLQLRLFYVPSMLSWKHGWARTNIRKTTGKRTRVALQLKVSIRMTSLKYSFWFIYSYNTLVSRKRYLFSWLLFLKNRGK